ncbi:F-actin-monooxygenase MICAL2-like isoform X2 [Peromyscus californicus insignis]|uniref:F-actin-monooxygenase MICAL2-like isoform X2 n=1 Tax=Peromyscus californicus insignis TaxID=564181 RepID=UPI0022A72292|nr:F-actin-monooxygenase MICAL2-like isoform X2 [Peromyscus californicus insignis]
MEVDVTSPQPSEWTSVRIGPGEDAVGQDVLAVRVLVTSEDSSSDAESDCGSIRAPCAKARKERPQLPESTPLSKPPARHSSLREPLTRPVSLLHHEEPQAIHALQRTHSLQSPAPSKYQNWRRKFPSNSTPMNKRAPSPPKEPPPPPSLSSSSSLPSSFSSASVPGHTSENFSPPRVPAYSLHSLPVSRGDLSPIPLYLRRARAQGILKEVPLYLPHGPMLESTGLGSPSGEDLSSPVQMASEDCREARAPLGSTKSMYKDSHPVAGEDQLLSHQNLALGAAGNPRELKERPRRGQTGGPELSEERKLGLKKLVLTQEQKTMLLDWSDSTPEHKAGERLSQERAENGRGRTLKSSTLPQAVKEKLISQTGIPEEMRPPTVKAPREREVPPPKSPLRFIANAILKSLLPNSEGGKKTCPKPESKTLPRGQPHTFTRSFSFRKPSSIKDGDQQSPGRHMAKKASAFFSLASPTSKTAQASDLSLPDPILRTRSLPSRPSKMFSAATSPPPRSKIEDVPTLLEKVSLQDATQVPKKRALCVPSLGLKDKSFESFLQECKQRKDIGDFFNSPKEKGPPRNRVPSLEKPAQPFGSTSRGQVAHPSSTGQDTRTTVTEAISSPSSATSSSADEDFDSRLSSRSKEKIPRRRRKLEKQLVKQEELKRLHKAQAIQRQLEEVEEQQRTSEIRGVKLEKVLRGEADSGTQDEAQLLQEWFKLVLEKNKLMRYESELLIMAQELELEDHQSRLEQKLREKMLKDEGQKDESDLKEEQEIFEEMMQVIEQRNKLVDSLEEQRVKERTQDQHFENFVLSRGCQLSRT